MDPLRRADQAVAQRIGPMRLGLRWMQPVCKWTFELAYRVDAEDIAIDTYAKSLQGRPVLQMDPTEGLDKARHLLKATLAEAEIVTAGVR